MRGQHSWGSRDGERGLSRTGMKRGAREGRRGGVVLRGGGGEGDGRVRVAYLSAMRAAAREEGQ